ncbi:MAG: pyridoxal 5'-phosphate synthase glutaminase subunit PdxT [Candidatus Bipolaricaulota bacterium]|nr:pyridoxal 5'-phosphate synthase glutaminase subunit PdxT [Candidatus Bipolaricaulota bacterium]MCS7275380.1 pyridoxal 5'-phosphate synthase glutaminase subunit PdxT [Candidatus Bipolaricaulota bacterium]MDW8110121.1 pyridoxal 5'-phosphate synthase glutaminase subunit PdxT [Candidatus Bipolaricaulota bacterium]MDW8328959.1 pyridoxal 5'-phosphate synthase glutaminase subunit PdxT [Candidatus Bipolaricaulota bacterium]
MRVGVLGLQGDFREHLTVLRSLGVDARDVRTQEQLEAVEGLIIPGGESTTIAYLLEKTGMLKVLRERGAQGFPLYGTCAGMILLARELSDPYPENRIALMDIAVKRNAYGRQLDSFEADLQIKNIGSFRAVFIRAPKIVRVGSGVEILAEHDGVPVLVRQKNLLASSFHPELTGDPRVHRYFLEMVAQG